MVGMVFGAVVWLFMDFVVLALSRARMTPVSSWPFWVNIVQQGLMVGLSCNSILATPLDDVIKGEKRPQDEVLRLAEVLGV